MNNDKRGKGCLLTILTAFATLVIIGGVGILGITLLGSGSSEEDTKVSENTYVTQDTVQTQNEDLESQSLRDHYTQIKGDGSDVYTIMVYMIGSDLESFQGSATSDLEEMLQADLGSQVNLIVMTGGTSTWQNDVISSDTCQYWQIKDGEFLCLEENLGLLNMTSEETLSGFIDYAKNVMPANRYGMILWDHGGGTFAGYGQDENYPDGVLTLTNLRNAFAAGGVLFDFVGFDACLMGTAETAVMLEPYADYLIASEESEPGDGWYYTDWLTNLGFDTSVSTIDLGTSIVDDYVETSYAMDRNAQVVLSVIELREMPAIYQQLCDYFSNVQVELQEQNYSEISTARSTAKAFGEGEMEQVDIVDFVQREDVEGSENVVSAVNTVVKYSNASPMMSGANGLAIYFPYDYLEYYSEMGEMLRSVGYTDEYFQFFDQFVSVMAGGQIQHENNQSGINEDSIQDYSEEDWFDSDVVSEYEDSYGNESDYYNLTITEKGDDFVLHMSDEQWADIVSIEQQVLLDDGEGYIDLGSDTMYGFDDDGDLIVEFDYTWVTLDGDTVPFYTESEVSNDDGTWFSYGHVPAILNGEEYIELIVYWDDEEPGGYVAGYRKSSDDISPTAKGYLQLNPGDSLEWLFDYYDYDLYYDDTYTIGDPFIVGNDPIQVSYDNVGDLDALVYFELKDIYNNVYDTEAITYSD